MATTLVDLIGDVSDAIAGDFDPRRTKAYIRHNTAIVVTDDGFRLGGGTVNVNDDGTFTLPDVVAATTLVENLQATVYIDYADPTTRARVTATLGPYDLSAETGTVDIRDLEAVQALDPTYASEFMDQAQALLDAQIVLSGIDDTDSGVAGVVGNSMLGPLTNAALETTTADGIDDDADDRAIAVDDRIETGINTKVVHLAGDYAGATDSDKIIAAIAAANTAGGGIVRLNRRALTTVWDLNGAPTFGINVPSGVHIQRDPGVTLNITGVISDSAVFTAAGSEGSKTALTVNLAAGALSAALPTGAGAGFSPGDLIAIEANVAVFGTGRAREIQRIVKIVTDTVYFSTPLLDSYTTANSSTFSKITPVKDIGFHGLRFTNSNGTTNLGYAIRVSLGENVWVDDFTLTDMGGGIEFRECMDVTVDGGVIDRLRTYGSSYGYGIDLIGACSSISISNIVGRSMRHLITTLGQDRSGTMWGYPKHVVISNCIGTGDTDSLTIFDTHEAGRDISFNNCVAIGGGSSCSGFQMRAKDVKLNNCTADRNGLRALVSTSDATGLRVQGGHFTRTVSDAGIVIAGNDTIIQGAEVSKNAKQGIAVSASTTGFVVKDCIIKDNGQVSSGYGIHDQGATSPVYDGNLIPQSAAQTVSILAIPATGVATNNVCMGYGTTSWGFTSAHASSTRIGNQGDGGTETTAGHKVLGKIASAVGTTTQAGLNVPHGAAPTSPVNGDIWTTTAGLYVRINGATVGPLT